MKIKRKIIEIDESRCSGCGQCVMDCAEGAIAIIDGKARLVSENYCDGLGACLSGCPEDALTITERESEEFDPEAVELHLKAEDETEHFTQAMACGCPSQNIEVFAPSVQKSKAAKQDGDVYPSALQQWPVQIRLIPPSAPFLKNADLLIAADCTPLAYGGFHQNLMPGKTVMLGCPKFDDVEEYLEKFTEIFKNSGVKSATVVEMEVPCCSKLPMLVRRAIMLSGKRIPLEEITISRKGDILQKRAVA
jgi:Pyruvate/2-oxoacid:ferredoxin oxidoreductase delta subunit